MCVRVHGEFVGGDVVPLKASPAMADGRGGSAEVRTRQLGNTEGEGRKQMTKEVKKGLWNSPATSIGQQRGKEGGRGEQLQWRR